MIIINTFSLAFSKTYCLFHFKTKICFFSSYFFILTIFGPRKKCNLHANIFFEDFSMELKYLEDIKEIIIGIYCRFS